MQLVFVLGVKIYDYRCLFLLHYEGIVRHLYSSHKNSKGIIESHLLRVVPYGRSHNIISIVLSDISFINSRQSPCHNSISFNLIYFPSIKRNITYHIRLALYNLFYAVFHLYLQILYYY